MVEKYCFTFGLNHPFSKYYIEVVGDVTVSRVKMCSVFGTNWAFQYTPTEFASIRNKHGIKKLVTF